MDSKTVRLDKHVASSLIAEFLNTFLYTRTLEGALEPPRFTRLFQINFRFVEVYLSLY